jgi:predicted RNA-binding protein (virulence factor B family)
MAVTEKSDAIVINKVFNMSKKAFKIAIGGLYKERLIEIYADKIILL